MQTFLSYNHDSQDQVASILADLDELAQAAPDFEGRKYAQWKRRLWIAFAVLIALITLAIFIMQRDPAILMGFLPAMLALLALPSADEPALARDTDEAFEQLRDRVRRYWLEGSLRPGLEEVRALGIPILFNTKAVVQHRAWRDAPIQHTLDIRTVYDGLESFAILGNPGSGKTTVIMQLALDLLKDPKRCHHAPFLLNLSSWRPNHSLRDWIVIEGQKSYHAAAKLIERWLDDQRLIVLLDGFDEVPDEHRRACIAAINTFRRDHPRLHVIVATRTAEFRLASDDMQQAFDLNGAIELGAIEAAQIESYLEADGLDGLRQLYHENPAVQEMAKAPFLLNSLAYTYAGKPLSALEPDLKTIPERQQHLFNAYLEKRLTPLPKRYTLPQMKQWLGWLANKIGYYGTIFRPSDVGWRWFDDVPHVQKRLRWIVTVPIFLILIVLWTAWGYALGGVLGVIILGLVGAGIGYAMLGTYYQERRSQFRLSWAAFKRRFHNMIDDSTLIQLIIMVIFTSALMPPLAAFFSSWILTGAFAIVLWSAIIYFFIAEGEAANAIFFITYIGIPLIALVWVFSHTLSIVAATAFITALTSLVIIILMAIDESAPSTKRRLVEHFSFPVLLILLCTLFLPEKWISVLVVFVTTITAYPLLDGIDHFIRQRLVRRYQPRPIAPYLNFVRSRHILREMGGSYTFRHEALRMGLLGASVGAAAQIKALSIQLGKGDKRALYTLQKYGKLATQVLIDLLQDQDSYIRRGAIRALGEISDTLAVKPLLVVLDDPDFEISESAADALRKIGKPAVEPLINALKDQDSDFRRSAADALGLIGDTRAVESLINLLQDQDSYVRRSAADALRKIGTPEAREALRNAGYR